MLFLGGGLDQNEPGRVSEGELGVAMSAAWSDADTPDLSGD
jgi:hypothetical protein